MELNKVFKGALLALIIVGITMFAMNQPDQPRIKILTNDEDVIEIPKDLAFQSSYIKNIAEDLGELDAHIPLPNINAKEFNLIINIMQAINNGIFPAQEGMLFVLSPDEVRFKREDGKYIAQRIQPLIDRELSSVDGETVAKVVYAAQALDLEQIANGAIRVFVQKALAQNANVTVEAIKTMLSQNINWPDSLDPLLEYQYQLVKNRNIPERSVTDYIALMGMQYIQYMINREDLDLSGRGLTSLEGFSTINGLANLKRLDLGRNRLMALPPTLFTGLKNLEVLYISENLLTNLPEGIFNNLTNLQELYINYNRLTTLPTTLFAGLTNLRKLDISFNPFINLPNGIFDNLRNLQQISLGGGSPLFNNMGFSGIATNFNLRARINHHPYYEGGH